MKEEFALPSPANSETIYQEVRTTAFLGDLYKYLRAINDEQQGQIMNVTTALKDLFKQVHKLREDN